MVVYGLEEQDTVKDVLVLIQDVNIGGPFDSIHQEMHQPLLYIAKTCCKS